MFAPAGDDGVEAVVCYICHVLGPDADGESLRRGCACRGEDAGFVHLLCLAVYAASVSGRANALNWFVKVWKRYSICNQCFRGGFANYIATALVLFVTDEYYKNQDNFQNNILRQVLSSLGVKLSALEGLF
jgi:hypothetical protein